MKKKIESKLAHGVRQVKSQVKPQHEQHPPTLANTAATEKPAASPKSGNMAPTPATPHTTQQSVTRSDDLHPRRVWPD